VANLSPALPGDSQRNPKEPGLQDLSGSSLTESLQVRSASAKEDVPSESFHPACEPWRRREWWERKREEGWEGRSQKQCHEHIALYRFY
jgi:hypothetical protein